MGGGITTGTLAVLVITMWGYAVSSSRWFRGGIEPGNSAAGDHRVDDLGVRRGGATWLMLVSQSITLMTRFQHGVSLCHHGPFHQANDRASNR